MVVAGVRACLSPHSPAHSVSKPANELCTHKASSKMTQVALFRVYLMAKDSAKRHRSLGYRSPTQVSSRYARGVRGVRGAQETLLLQYCSDSADVCTAFISQRPFRAACQIQVTLLTFFQKTSQSALPNACLLQTFLNLLEPSPGVFCNIFMH